MKNEPKRQLLAIGPLPPPVAGTSVSFKLFCDFVEDHSRSTILKIVNSSPKSPEDRPLFDLSNLLTAMRVLSGCVRHVWTSDKVILFGSNQFLLTLMPVCFGIAKIAGKSFYVRSFGGSLDTYYESLSPFSRRYFDYVLARIDGLIVQTESLKLFFENKAGASVHQVPGYRKMPGVSENRAQEREAKTPMRLVYVGHIREEKGIFELLTSIEAMNDRLLGSVVCDLYGPVYNTISEQFEKRVALTSGMNYRGILNPDAVIPTLRNYDVFVFPTYYKGEGHPGVLIEALMAGLPIVTTNFKSIPDLIEDRHNGLLVSPKNPEELMAAIDLLNNNQTLLKELTKQATESGNKYDSDQVVPRILSAMGE